MAYGLPDLETSLYLPSTILEDTETSATGNECEKPIEHLNNFLKSRDISPIRYSLRTPWNEASGRTKRQHERKARQAISAVLDEIAHNDADRLWESILCSEGSQNGDNAVSSGVDKELMDTLANCYKNANSWMLAGRYCLLWPIK